MSLNINDIFAEEFGTTTQADIPADEADVTPEAEPEEKKTARERARPVSDVVELAIRAGLHPQPMFEVEGAPTGAPKNSAPLPFDVGELPESRLESERLLTPEQAAHFLGTTKAALAKHRVRDTGPAYLKSGERQQDRIKYVFRDLVAYAATMQRVATRDQA